MLYAGPGPENAISKRHKTETNNRKCAKIWKNVPYLETSGNDSEVPTDVPFNFHKSYWRMSFREF